MQAREKKFDRGICFGSPFLLFFFFSLPERENIIRAPARPQSLSCPCQKRPQPSSHFLFPSLPQLFWQTPSPPFSFQLVRKKRNGAKKKNRYPRQCLERKGPLLFSASHLSSTLCAESKATEHKYPCEEVRQTSFFLIVCTVTQVTESQLEMQISKSIHLKLF